VTPDRLIVVGHSAGGTIALWAAGRDGDVVPSGFLSLAGVSDLVTCAEEGQIEGACTRIMGGSPTDVPQHYRQASPTMRLPTGRRQLLVHGEDDDIVPISQSVDYVAAAQAAGDQVDLVRVPNAGHFQLIDIKHPAYGDVLTSINRLMTPANA
jgi:dipeptidyl aminopeptidase/acylaminoacyl peptidase